MFNVSCYDETGRPMENLTQWDVNRTLVIKGANMDSAPAFHFHNRASKSALVVEPAVDDGALTAKIPNILLQQALPIVVHMYYENADGSAKTLHTIIIPVRPRPKPDNYEFVENIEYISWKKYEEEIRALIEDMQKSVPIIIGNSKPEQINVLWFDTNHSNT